MDIDSLFKYLKDVKASDLHLRVGNKPFARISGELCEIPDQERVTAEKMERVIDKLLIDEEKKKFRERKNLDMSYSIQGIGRFRVNIYVQRGTVALVARRIEENIFTIDELGLPEVLKTVMKEQRGIILVTGATGNGKSTTVAAMIEHVNSTYKRNVITLEDPIEFLFKDKKSIVSQREIPTDTDSYKTALKYVLRQDPDIIFVGELRDIETVDAALKAAETGHLVISTLHTVNAAQTISRIIDFYSSEQQKQIRYQLSSNIRAVISQRLLPSTVEKKMVVAIEIMRDSPTIKDLILTAEGVKQIPEAIKTGKDVHQMQTFDQAIAELYLQGQITYDTALNAATVKKDIEFIKHGISNDGMSKKDYYKSMLEEDEDDTMNYF
ncbi:MAG: PilT/PilU family type 4a pilus ATPase [Fusobacteria bacterium]|nr:PilT/PilU family type 4a pilus ATPase [Fusobacteriota bacterium]